MLTCEQARRRALQVELVAAVDAPRRQCHVLSVLARDTHEVAELRHVAVWVARSVLNTVNSVNLLPRTLLLFS